jgi:hypothetical protein
MMIGECCLEREQMDLCKRRLEHTAAENEEQYEIDQIHLSCNKHHHLTGDFRLRNLSRRVRYCPS